MAKWVRGLVKGGAAAALAGAVLAGTPVRADDPSFVAGGVGYFDINDNWDAASFNLEYRSNLKLWFLKPFVGAMVTTDSSVYGYGGLYVDLYFGRRIVLTPNVAVGAYSEGDGKDLGHTVEFRSGLELAYRFDNRARLGVSFHHISNASLGDSNPGTEILGLFLSWPLGGAGN
jgi:hypothetical protein